MQTGLLAIIIAFLIKFESHFNKTENVITNLLLFSALVEKEASFHLLQIGDERNRNSSVQVGPYCCG